MNENPTTNEQTDISNGTSIFETIISTNVKTPNSEISSTDLDTHHNSPETPLQSDSTHLPPDTNPNIPKEEAENVNTLTSEQSINSTPTLTDNLEQISEQLMLSNEVLNVTANNPSPTNQTTTETLTETNQITSNFNHEITDVLQVFETNTKSKEPNHDLPTDQNETSVQNQEKIDQERHGHKTNLNEVNLIADKLLPTEKSSRKHKTTHLNVPQSNTKLITESNTPRHEIYLNDFLKKGILPEFYERPGVMQYIQRLSVNAVMNGDYGEAEKYQMINKQFYEACIEQQSKERIERELKILNDQEENVNKELSECKAKWKEIIAKTEKEEKEKFASLLSKQQEELHFYDEKWKSEETLRPFTKQSSELLEVRTKEKYLIISRQFKDAENERKYGDEREKEERRRNQQNAEKEAINGRMQIIQRHQIEQIQMIEKANQKIANLLQRREEELKILQIRFVKIEFNRSKVGKNKGSDVESIVKMRSKTSSDNGLLSPRSQLKMDQYRKKSTVSRLVLKPITKFPKVNTRSSKTSLRNSRSGK